MRHELRDKLRKYLLKNISTDIHYPIPPYRQNALKKYFKDKFPIADEIHSSTLSCNFFYIQKVIFKITKIMNRF